MEGMRKWYPTYVLPPLEIEMGRLEIDEIEEMIVYIEPQLPCPYRKRTLLALDHNKEKNQSKQALELSDEREEIDIFESRAVPVDDFSQQLSSQQHSGVSRKHLSERLQKLLDPLNSMDQVAAYQLVHSHLKIRRDYLKTLRALGKDALQNNKTNVGNGTVQQNHINWVKDHSDRIVDAKTKHKEHVQKTRDHVLSTTSAARALVKKQHRQRLILQERQRESMTVLFVATAMTRFKLILFHQWEMKRLEKRVRKYALIWLTATRLTKAKHAASTNIVAFLQASGLSSVSSKITFGLRRFLNKVCIMQRRWRHRLQKRSGRLKVLTFLWDEHARVELLQLTKKTVKKTASLRKKPQGRTKKKVITIVPIPDSIRDTVLAEYLLTAEEAYRAEQAEFEAMTYPHLVQVLYDHYEGITRLEAQVLAKLHRKNGTMLTALTQFAGKSIGYSFPVFSYTITSMTDLYKHARTLVPKPTTLLPAIKKNTPKSKPGRRATTLAK